MIHGNRSKLWSARNLILTAVFALLCNCALSVARAQETPTLRLAPPPQAPPPAPPIETRTSGSQKPSPVPKGPLIQYSIGQPTDEEQLYLEYINRCRANPTAEGVLLANTTDPDVLSAYSFFSVN